MTLTIILNIILAVLVILLAVMLWFASFIRTNNRFLVPKEEKYGVDMGLKALIIYQPSKHNTTYNMVMAAVDVFVKNGYEVTVNYPNKGVTYNMADYDIILFGSPVYCGAVSKCLLFYLEHCIFAKNKIGIFLTGTAEASTMDFEEIDKRINSDKTDVRDVKRIKLGKENEEDMRKFVNEIIG